MSHDSAHAVIVRIETFENKIKFVLHEIKTHLIILMLILILIVILKKG